MSHDYDSHGLAPDPAQPPPRWHTRTDVHDFVYRAKKPELGGRRDAA